MSTRKRAEGAPVELGSKVATRWRSFTDSGGDYALAAEIGDRTLVVFGSADPAHSCLRHHPARHPVAESS